MNDKLFYDLYKSLDDDTPINVSIPITKNQLRQILKEEFDQLEKTRNIKKSLYSETLSENKESSSPYKDKVCLTLNEAAKIYHIGTGKLRNMTNEDNCPFVLFVGNKRLIKRKTFEEYLNKSYSI